MLPAMLFALAAIAAEPQEPKAAISFGTGARYAIVGLRGSLPIFDQLWVSAAIGLPPVVYSGILQPDDLEDPVPTLRYMEVGWPGLSTSVAFHQPISGAFAFHLTLTALFVHGHRVAMHDPVSNTSVSFSLLPGIQIEIAGPVFLDLGVGPSYTFSKIDWREDEFDRNLAGFGLDWALGFGYTFL
jgi:hypothetical protein